MKITSVSVLKQEIFIFEKNKGIVAGQKEGS